MAWRGRLILPWNSVVAPELEHWGGEIVSGSGDPMLSEVVDFAPPNASIRLRFLRFRYSGCSGFTIGAACWAASRAPSIIVK
jgi:hypothetical protein